MIVLVVMEELERHFLGRRQLGEDLWVWGSHDTSLATELTCSKCASQLVINVSSCPGGAYSQVGSLFVGEVETVFTTRTVWGIMGRRSVFVSYHFEYCEREFPDNLIAFVKLAAANTNRCYKLAFSRGWARYHRRCRDLMALAGVP